MKNGMKYLALFFFCLAGLAACEKERTEIPQNGIYKGEFMGYYYDHEYNKVEMDTIAYYYVREVTDNHIIIGWDTIVKNNLFIEGHLHAYEYIKKEGWCYRFRLASISGKLVEFGNEYQMKGHFSCLMWTDSICPDDHFTGFQEHTIMGAFKIYPIDSFMQE